MITVRCPQRAATSEDMSALQQQVQAAAKQTPVYFRYFSYQLTPVHATQGNLFPFGESAATYNDGLAFLPPGTLKFNSAGIYRFEVMHEDPGTVGIKQIVGTTLSDLPFTQTQRVTSSGHTFTTFSLDVAELYLPAGANLGIYCVSASDSIYLFSVISI